jgi:hypothetical protein
MDILSYFSLPLFVTEEKLIMTWISTIEDHPVIARIISIFLNLYTSVNDAELRRSGDKNHGSFIYRAFTIEVNEVDKGWYLCKVDDLIVFLKIAWGFFLTYYIGEGIYGGH